MRDTNAACGPVWARSCVPPRPWHASVGGIIWLPRLIDKARAFEHGTLGTYLDGQSPVDDSLLAAARVSYDQVRAASAQAVDDADVLALLEAQAPGARARLQAWSAAPPALCRAIVPCVHANEGRATGPARLLALIPEPLYAAVVALLRWRRPYA